MEDWRGLSHMHARAKSLLRGARARRVQSDLEIARGATLLLLEEVAAKVGLTAAGSRLCGGRRQIAVERVKERMIDRGGCGTRLAARRCALPRSEAACPAPIRRLRMARGRGP